MGGDGRASRWAVPSVRFLKPQFGLRTLFCIVTFCAFLAYFIQRDEYRVKHHSVADLLSVSTQAELTKLITWAVAPDSWEHVGGRAYLKFSRKSRAVIIFQTDEAHNEIRRLFESLRTGKDLLRPEDAHIRSVLTHSFTFDLPTQPLTELVKNIAVQTGIPIRMDYITSPEIGWDIGIPVILDVRKKQLAEALD